MSMDLSVRISLVRLEVRGYIVDFRVCVRAEALFVRGLGGLLKPLASRQVVHFFCKLSPNYFS